MPRFKPGAFIALLLVATETFGQDTGPEPQVPPSGSEPAAVPRRHTPRLRRTFLDEFVERDTLTKDWGGGGQKLEDLGITLHLNFWAVFQANVSGGLSAGQETSGQYRIATDFDLERLVGLDAGNVFFEIRGGWDDDPNADVGSLIPVNGEFEMNDPIYVSQLWYQQGLLDDRLRFRVGKLDTGEGFDFHGQTVAFDANAYANFGGTQFLNAGLINNPSIAFPDFGVGAAMFGEPVERVYVAGAVANANADATTLGFSDVFGGDPKWFFVAETGFVPELRSSSGALSGQFNLGYWHSQFQGLPSGQGVYLGMNQLVYRETADDLQGLGIFARYGWAENNPLGVSNFWSLGARYRGLIPGRDRDILGLGWAQAFTVSDPAFTAPYEGVLEAYYRARVTPWFLLSPMIQYVVNPGSTDLPDAVVLGLRGQFVF
ncbi:MAG: carbohydrate porin [Planctomycetota bacterium]|jgi:porin